MNSNGKRKVLENSSTFPNINYMCADFRGEKHGTDLRGREGSAVTVGCKVAARSGSWIHVSPKFKLVMNKQSKRTEEV
jgi:hypothetical protein